MSASVKANDSFLIYQRPFSCMWCTKTFVNSANCRKHKLKDHPHDVAEYEGKFKFCLSFAQNKYFHFIPAIHGKKGVSLAKKTVQRT